MGQTIKQRGDGMKKIKACPFCGEYPELELNGGYYRIECKNRNCPSRLVASIKPNDIITAWNTRLKPKKGEPDGL